LSAQQREKGELPVALDTKYTVQEAAKIMNCSENTVRRRFHDDPKVGRIGTGETRKKRRYYRVLIPESSLVRWWDELTENGRSDSLPPGVMRLYGSGR
jgi:hypothetical protein